MLKKKLSYAVSAMLINVKMPWIVGILMFMSMIKLCSDQSMRRLTSWLSFVVSNCEFVTFRLVYWVRCGT